MGRTIAIATASALLGSIGCVSDPVYVQPMDAIEVGAEGTDINTATAQITMPVRLETEEELEDRTALEAELAIQVPFVTRDELLVSVEWVIRNLSDEDGSARIHVNGANEYFAYVPIAFVIDPEEDEEPPPLLGDIPLDVPASGSISGVFREDQLKEAANDLELITRGGLNPFAARLQNHEDLRDFTDSGGALIPAEAFAQLIRFDLTLIANRHMVLEYTVRVRDDRDPQYLHDELLAAPAEELTVFAPADFAPVVAP